MSDDQKQPITSLMEIPDGAQIATLGAGCFWCVEAAYHQIDGVHSAVSGYMGGESEHPTYEQVCSGNTGYAEVVRVVFDPAKIDYETILAWFWDLHDPTQLNRQGNDVGTQYRSAIFYENEEQRNLAERSKQAAQEHLDRPIVTEIVPTTTFFPAEDYHQNYYFLNKTRNSYCQFVVEPKLKKLKLNH